MHGMTLGRVFYFGLVGFLALLVLSFFALFSSTNQGTATFAVGWLVVLLSLQVSKVARR